MNLFCNFKKISPHRLLLSLLVSNIILIIAMSSVCIKYDIFSKILVKIGLKDAPISSDYLAAISWSHTMESMKYHADIVFFGASLTSDGRWQDYFDTLNVCNLGKSGDKLSTMIWRVPQITAVKPKKIFFALEHNDLQESEMEEIKNGYNILLDSIIKENPDAEIFLESLTPLNECKFNTVCDNYKIKYVNKMIEQTARERGLCYINIYDIFEEDGQLPLSLSYDGQHLRPEAYSRWVGIIQKYVGRHK